MYKINITSAIFTTIIVILWLLIKSRLSCRILALSGGGAHGSFQAGVIKKLHDTGHQWDVITGISSGSLNSIILALYYPKDQQYAVNTMELIWNCITQKDVYTKNWDPLFDQSIYDNAPLNFTVHKYISEIGGKIKRNIIIGAVEMNTGRMILFDQRNMTTLNDVVNIVMSSASAPIVFPPRLYNGKYYVDGGLFSNELIVPGIHYCLERNMTNITIDAISCDAPVEEISSKEISTYYLYNVIYRDYNIAMNALLNHELYSDCNKKNHKYDISQKLDLPMYLYKPTQPIPGGWLDFDHDDMVEAFNIGSHTDSTKITYCY